MVEILHSFWNMHPKIAFLQKKLRTLQTALFFFPSSIAQNQQPELQVCGGVGHFVPIKKRFRKKPGKVCHPHTPKVLRSWVLSVVGEVSNPAGSFWVLQYDLRVRGYTFRFLPRRKVYGLGTQNAINLSLSIHMCMSSYTCMFMYLSLSIALQHHWETVLFVRMHLYGFCCIALKEVFSHLTCFHKSLLSCPGISKVDCHLYWQDAIWASLPAIAWSGVCLCSISVPVYFLAYDTGSCVGRCQSRPNLFMCASFL